MTLTEHYADYKWIKVKRYDGYDPNIPADENYANLDHHHRIETTFLINEVRKLAAMIDERDKAAAEAVKRIEDLAKRQEELAKNQKDPWPPEEWAPH